MNWLPLGAGGRFVRLNGRVYEALSAWMQRRPTCDLYHSALQIQLPEGTYVGRRRAVGSRWDGRFRIFRYEIRLWLGGHIPDVAEAVESPRRLAGDE
jgi:hypothetical protein